MARISTYPLDTNLIGTDYWIGSDANSSYATKNFTIASVAEYMNREATQQQSIRFVYTNTVPVAAGSLSFAIQGADTVPFSGITTFKLSKYNLIELTTNVSGFYETALIGADILITQSDDPAIWGVFTWNSAAVDGSGNFYDIGLTHKNSQNGLTVNKDYFISLLTYPGTSIYTVTHGLNKFPSVTVFSGTTLLPGVEVYCDVNFVNKNIVTLTFVNTFTGVVTFN